MARNVGEWTKDKLKILSQYLPVYLQATTKALERIYIDGFAGPGSNRVKTTEEIIDGSPLIALKAVATNGTRFDRLYFIELNGEAAQELRGTISQRYPERNATVITGDVNLELPRLIATLPKRSPTFVFLDTEGIEPKWSTIEAVAPWKTELLINFPLGMAINRNPNSQKVTHYFGTDEWRAIWESSRSGRLRDLLNLYKNRLRTLGYEYTTEVDPLIRTPGGQDLYYLVFVSKVEPAKRIMKWVQEQPDSRGQLGFRF